MEQISRSDGKFINAVVSASYKNAPGVIIIQEWWGINDQMKERAKRFEDAGFRIVLPDLYRGTVVDFHKTAEAKHSMDSLDFADALNDIQACVDYLLSSGSPTVGITGYCMGGALALAAAAKCKNVTSVAPFYGLPPPTLCDISAISIPVQGHFADHDIPHEKLSKIEHEISSSDKVFHIYKGTKHAFTNEGRPEVYDKDATQTSMDRTFVFFGRTLFK